MEHRSLIAFGLIIPRVMYPPVDKPADPGHVFSMRNIFPRERGGPYRIDCDGLSSLI